MIIETNGARENMIDCQLLPNEVTSEPLLAAIREVERPFFAPEIFSGTAYADEDIPLSAGRWMLKPMVFARLIQLAELTRKDKVLYVGAGSGYGPAVAAHLAEKVVAVECLRELADIARQNLQDQNVKVEVFCSPLTVGYPLSAPYDVIIIEGAVQQISAGLLEQLRDGGRLVAIQNIQQRVDGGRRGLGRAFLGRKEGKQLHRQISFDAAAAVLPGFEVRQEFVF